MEHTESTTIKNLEAAFAGESMAHIKYLYFARICRARGDEQSAKLFETTAAQEVQHAFGHLDLLFPESGLTPERCLELAIEGETYEYTEMYPGFRHLAEQEKNSDAVREFDEQIDESREHAEQFQASDFVAWRSMRLDEGNTPNTVNNALAYLRALFRELERKGYHPWLWIPAFHGRNDGVLSR